jgi:hypothetical protein
MQQNFELWRFEVDSEKAVRRGISVDAINRNLGMAMGGARLGDVKRGNVLEPTYIVLQVPMAIRSKISSLADLPISSPAGGIVPLGELGHFVKGLQDPIIYHKDLRPVEYITGEVTGLLDAPIYSMMEVDEKLQNYTTPDGQVISGEFLGAPETYAKSGFEWTGEWTVTFETFRDMGMAFGVALILIYMLVVWEFGNFTLPAIIMAPIPLTLLGIVPGHMIMDAKFTATSMIGFIALAGIIVRNSILLVDFAQQEIYNGVNVRDAVILSCKARTRPIVITALALVAGSSVIMSDFIFRGMAVSLLFGVLVSTVLTLLVIPLGCVTFASAFKHPDSLDDDDDSVSESGPAFTTASIAMASAAAVPTKAEAVAIVSSKSDNVTKPKTQIAAASSNSATAKAAASKTPAAKTTTAKAAASKTPAAKTTTAKAAASKTPAAKTTTAKAAANKKPAAKTTKSNATAKASTAVAKKPAAKKPAAKSSAKAKTADKASAPRRGIRMKPKKSSEG